MRQFFETIYTNERTLKPESSRQLRMSLDLFEQFAGPRQLDTLSHELLNSWVITNPRGWSPKTMRRRMADVLTVWSYAYAVSATDNKPNTYRMRRVKVAKRCPKAWTLDQLAAICAAADQFRRYLPNGVRVGSLVQSVVYVGFYSALRAADLQRLLRVEMSPTGQFVGQDKRHGNEVLVVIPQWVIDHVDHHYPPEIERVWAWPYTREHFYTTWKACLAAAGLPTGRTEGLQKLRRSAVSYGEAAKIGYGAQLAGHAPTSRITYEHYADPRIIAHHHGNLLPDLRHANQWQRTQGAS